MDRISIFIDGSELKSKLYLSKSIHEFDIEKAFRMTMSPKAKVSLSHNLLSINKKLNCFYLARYKIENRETGIGSWATPLDSSKRKSISWSEAAWLEYNPNARYSCIELEDLITVTISLRDPSRHFDYYSPDNKKLLVEINHFVSGDKVPEEKHSDQESFEKVKEAFELCKQYYALFPASSRGRSGLGTVNRNVRNQGVGRSSNDAEPLFDRKIMQLSIFLQLIEKFGKESIIEAVEKFQNPRRIPSMKDLVFLLKDWDHNKDYPLEWTIDGLNTAKSDLKMSVIPSSHANRN